MVGGLILMGILVMILPVHTAMILHGGIQLVSNGYRAWLNRAYIHWPVILRFILGEIAALGLFWFIAYVPERALVLLMLGALPYIAWGLPRRFALDITRPLIPYSAGFIVSLVNLVAGVGGPILDIFFQRTPLTRHQVVATKAILQALSHASKIIFYGALVLTSAAQIWAGWWVFPAFIIASIIGTRAGKRVLDYMSDTSFFRWTQAIMLIVGALFMIRGIILL